MERIKPTPVSIWDEFNRGKAYNTEIDLYETVKRNENFYIGRQWEGVNAPDLPQPVINVLRRVVSYFISMIVADDVGVSFTPLFEDTAAQTEGEPDAPQLEGTAELAAAVWSKEVERIIEQAKIKEKSREIIRNAAVNGESFLYLYFDPEDMQIKTEVIDNTNVLFGNPHSADIQKQPYILVEMRQTLEAVREEAKANGVSQSEIDGIKTDSDSDAYDISGRAGGELVTTVIRLWKEGGTVRAVKSVPTVIIRPEWDMGYRLYPLSVMHWERIKNSYHGQAALTGMIPNQIMINQLYAMTAHSVKMTAFPKILYDGGRIDKWSNKPGQAIRVTGNPNEMVANVLRGADMSAQVIPTIDSLIQKTLEFMGANDAALGNVKPDNTSAIVATQKASAMPLELQRLAFYQFTEEYIRILLDIMRADYGVRRVAAEVSGVRHEGMYDFSKTAPGGMDMKVDIGSASYWSELMQIQTVDNLFSKGIISDPETYLESIPDQYIRGKGGILRELREKKAQAEAQAEAQAQMQQPQQMPAPEMPQMPQMPEMPMM